MRRAVTWTAAVALAVLGLGIAVLPLQAPAFTRALSSRYSLASEAGLTQQQAISLAERVRAFVVEKDGQLPATVNGRPGFDTDAVSHLVDVADVIAGGRLLVAVLGALLLALAGQAIVRGRADLVSGSLRLGGLLSAALPLVIGLIGLIDFDGFFAAFHALFFAEGTWTFPYDSLLIRLFPEPFWIAGGISWAVSMVIVGALMVVAGVLIGRRNAANE